MRDHAARLAENAKALKRMVTPENASKAKERKAKARAKAIAEMSDATRQE